MDKLKLSNQSAKEGDTRNTSKEFEKWETQNQDSDSAYRSYIEGDSQLDNSFLNADIDHNEKQIESSKLERNISEKVTNKVYKTLASNLMRVFNKSRTYGCDCGDPTNPELNWWVRAENWLKYAFKGSNKKFGKKDQKVFQELIDMDVKKESKAETNNNDDRIMLTVCIENDLKRTFPQDDFYKNPKSTKILYDVLKAYTLYDNTCGYVQGMNFIAASLIYHSSSEIAFWLFISLIFDYHLRENYKLGFPGVKEINDQIKMKLNSNWPMLAKLFKATNTDFEMFTLEIIMSLFGITIPLDLTGIFYDNFFENSWNFFSNLIIEFLTEIQDNLLKLSDPWDIIRIIKSYTNPHLSNINNLIVLQNEADQSKIKFKEIDWKLLLARAESKMYE